MNNTKEQSKNVNGTSISFHDIGVAKIDCARKTRCGFPEFVYGKGKTIEQLLTIVPTLLDTAGTVLITQLNDKKGKELCKRFPQGEYDKLAKIFIILPKNVELHGNVVIATGGTSDMGVALEASYTLECCGIKSEIINDIGVAGIERLFAAHERLSSADVCIVIAGMEGALPSVVAGLVKIPVIAVPTSVGYGANFEGLAPLLGMLNSCASGVTVVNIDNGFGAACAAVRIMQLF